MNILICSFDSSIKIGRQATKKVPSYFYEVQFDYPLTTIDNQLKALAEFFNNDEAKLLSSEASNDLIISDEAIGFGTFDLPHLSRFRVKDVFNTRFMVNYPNYKEYYLDSYEFNRNQEGSVFFYSITKKSNITKLKDFFKSKSVNIRNINYFANNYINSFENKSIYPIATLFVGSNYSELIISKGANVLSINSFDYGSNLLLDGDKYLFSSYGYNNDISKKYAGFIKENFATKEIVSDENIIKTDSSKGLSLSLPKEVRVLKNQVLANYNIKNNIRKYYAMLLDITQFYSTSPWFLPLGEIKLVCTDEFYESLIANTEDYKDIKFIRCENNVAKMVEANINNNHLFTSSLKGERRKIDWKKFFSFDIGKKKKQ